jgi:peptidyl-prolyl cis-trans isomerase D
LIEDKASPADETEVKTNKFIVVWSVVYNQATGKNDTLPGFRTTKHNWFCEL